MDLFSQTMEAATMESIDEESSHELNITKLRREGRPLWMSDLGLEDYSEIMGGGGDIYTDRLPPAWPRGTGMELSGEEERELGPVDVGGYGERAGESA
jgi:hypothetical protein